MEILVLEWDLKVNKINSDGVLISKEVMLNALKQIEEKIIPVYLTEFDKNIIGSVSGFYIDVYDSITFQIEIFSKKLKKNIFEYENATLGMNYTVSNRNIINDNSIVHIIKIEDILCFRILQDGRPIGEILNKPNIKFVKGLPCIFWNDTFMKHRNFLSLNRDVKYPYIDTDGIVYQHCKLDIEHIFEYLDSILDFKYDWIAYSTGSGWKAYKEEPYKGTYYWQNNNIREDTFQEHF